jgi:hypothetical protein
MRAERRMRTRFITIVAVFVIAGACLGYWLQSEQPDDAHRARHPQAYSICLPQGWSAQASYSEGFEPFAGARVVDTLVLSPDDFLDRRPQLTVNRLSGIPDSSKLRADGWDDGRYAGQPALMRNDQLKHGYRRAAVVQEGGTWFELELWVSVAGSAQIERWWQFAQTLRYPDGTPPKPAALPAATQGSATPFVFPGNAQ